MVFPMFSIFNLLCRRVIQTGKRERFQMMFSRPTFGYFLGWPTNQKSLRSDIYLGLRLRTFLTIDWLLPYLEQRISLCIITTGKHHLTPLRCSWRDIAHEPQPKPDPSATHGECQGHRADEAGRSVQDGTTGEVCVLAIAESEQYVTDESD